MEKIIAYLDGNPYNGGSYQYWLAVLKVLSKLDSKKYFVKVYTKYPAWYDNARRLHISAVLVEKKRNFLDI